RFARRVAFAARFFDFRFGFFGRLGVPFAGRLFRLPFRLFGGVFGLDLFPGVDHAGPDQRREGAAHHRAAVVEGGHRRRRVGVADPDAGGDFVGDAAAEPGVAVVLGRPRLPPLVFGADVGRLAGAAGDHGF